MRPATEGESTYETLVVFTSTFPRWANDSVPHFVHDVAEGLVPHFDNVKVVAPHYPGAKKHERLPSGIEVHRLQYRLKESRQTLFYDASAAETVTGSISNTFSALFYCARVLGWILARRPDHRVVLNPRWILPHGFLAILAGMIFRKSRIVVSVHGADIFSLRSPLAIRLKRMTLRRAHAVVVNSEHTRRACEDVLDREYHVISSGFDSRIFSPGAGRRVRRSSDDPLHLLSAGRLSPEKGVSVIIMACYELRANGRDVRLTIAGDGPERLALESLARELGVEHVVEFKGWLDKPALASCFREADLFVGGSQKMASGWQEAFGNVYAESMACGTPVLIPESAGASILVTHGVNGIKVREVSQRTLFDAIEQYCMNPESAKTMTRGAIEAVEGFSLKNSVARYIQVLDPGASISKSA